MPNVDLLGRIRGEFREMPGLKLTIPQACRLWNLGARECQDAIDALVAEGFLFRTPSGAFVALPSTIRMAKVEMDALSFRCPHCRHRNSIVNGDVARQAPATVTLRCAACSRTVSVNLLSA